MKSLLCVSALALGFWGATAMQAVAAPPLVLAQFFEHFDEFDDAAPGKGGPALKDLDPGDLDPGDLEGLDGLGKGAEPGPEAGVPPLPQDLLPQDLMDGGMAVGQIPPDYDPADRPKLLAELYQRLAETRDAAAAEPITAAIEELWATSGSDTVDLLMGRATRFANEAELDLSLSILNAVVDIAPNEAEAWYLRSKVNVLAGKPESALADLRRALRLDAKHYRAIADLGLLLEQLGAKKEALEAYRRALAVNPFLDDAIAGVDALKREVEGQDI